MKKQPDLTNKQKFEKLKESFDPQLVEIVKAAIEDEIPLNDLLQAIFLIRNVKKFTGWGKVSLIVQNSRIVLVTQEQTHKVV